MLNDLQSLPAGVAEAGALIAQADELLRGGLAGGRQPEPLDALGAVFGGTPLEPLLAESLPALARGEFVERHVVALAAARAALQGARHDALWAQVRAALGRPADPGPAALPAPAAPDPLLEGVRHWLMELAITGFARLDAGALLPFLGTLERLRQQPELARLAFLLTAFADELLARVPLAADAVPLLRWCDLWSAAMLCACGRAAAPEPTPVSGTLCPLGVELRERGPLISLLVYALLLRPEGAEVVRLTRSRFKVDAIGGEVAWLLLPDLAPLVEALGQGLAVRDMPLLPSGDLLWLPEQAQGLQKVKLLDELERLLAPGAPAAASLRPPPPLERHPLQIAEPVLLSGYRLGQDGLELPDGPTLPLDPRWSPAQELSPALLEGSARMLALLRFDAGRWSAQPLAAAPAGGKLTCVGQASLKLFKKPPKSNPVAILEERASRLLRRK